MAFYFSLPHLGAGTSAIESLGSYFFRLADAHGCSTWQLASHMTAWWRRLEGISGRRYFPGHVLGTQSMAVCAHGKNVDVLVDALGKGTDCATLRGGTMLALRQVTSPSNIGMLKKWRAWCSACYAEDINAGLPVYDRLLWLISPIARCAVHRLALQEACPSCGARQYYAGRGGNLAICSCSSSLIGHSGGRVLVDQPTSGEKLVHELVEAVSADTGLELEHRAMRSVFLQIRSEMPKGHPLLAASSLFSITRRPSFGTLLKFCQAFDLSLLDFCSAAQTTRPLLTCDERSLRPKTRQWHPPAVRAAARKTLESLLHSNEPLPALAKICELMKVSPAYTAYRFANLHAKYMERRRLETQHRRQANYEAAIAAIDCGLLEDYKNGNITQQKQLIRVVAEKTGASIVITRKALHTRLHEHDEGV